MRIRVFTLTLLYNKTSFEYSIHGLNFVGVKNGCQVHWSIEWVKISLNGLKLHWSIEWAITSLDHRMGYNFVGV